MLSRIGNLFKSGWEYDFAIIQNAREKCLNHEYYDEENKKLLNKWKRALDKAESNIVLVTTKTGCLIKDDAKLSARFEYICSQRKELADQMKKQEKHENDQETDEAMSFVLGAPIRAYLRNGH